MGSVLQLVRRLDACPEVPAVPQVALRPYQGPQDIDLWLDIRRKSFARQKLGVRDWGHGEFQVEFLQQRWWSPQRMWFAVFTDPLTTAPRELGTATLGRRGSAESGKPVVHWLAVLPRYRRQGIARLLVRHLESLAWTAGEREMYLETHTAWSEALALYEALGYRTVD